MFEKGEEDLNRLSKAALALTAIVITNGPPNLWVFTYTLSKAPTKVLAERTQ